MNREAWVIVAVDEDGDVKQCTVRTSGAEAAVIFSLFQEDYGGRSVAFISRVIDSDTDLTPGQLEKLKLFRAEWNRTRGGGS